MPPRPTPTPTPTPTLAPARAPTRARILSALALVACVAGCLGSQSRPAKLQEAAQNLNVAARFGRMDIATELVADKALPGFAKRHAAWGRDVRLVDIEYQGMRFSDKENAVVFVVVGWQRLDEQELRVTNVAQRWNHGPKGWKLEGEERTGGDVGLLGEPTVVARPELHRDVHFEAVTIR